MWRWVVATLLFSLFFGLTWLLLTQAVVGPGYALWKVKGEYGFVVEDQTLLSRITTRIREAGGIVYTLGWVTSGGVDARAEYQVSIPSKEKPFVPISGCKVGTLLGMLSTAHVYVDAVRVREVWGEDAEKRLNGMMLMCLNHAMTRENEQVFEAGTSAIIEEMQDKLVFGVQ